LWKFLAWEIYIEICSVNLNFFFILSVCVFIFFISLSFSSSRSVQKAFLNAHSIRTSISDIQCEHTHISLYKLITSYSVKSRALWNALKRALNWWNFCGLIHLISFLVVLMQHFSQWKMKRKHFFFVFCYFSLVLLVAASLFFFLFYSILFLL
jgi:hypothetical protein